MPEPDAISPAHGDAWPDLAIRRRQLTAEEGSHTKKFASSLRIVRGGSTRRGNLNAEPGVHRRSRPRRRSTITHQSSTDPKDANLKISCVSYSSCQTGLRPMETAGTWSAARSAAAEDRATTNSKKTSSFCPSVRTRTRPGPRRRPWREGGERHAHGRVLLRVSSSRGKESGVEARAHRGAGRSRGRRR